jgi:lipid II:glycine glycyltransferase (peptidoglycan interpeptide bridge formation enzyme)
MVSLPFSDHCEPLVDSAEEMEFFVRTLQAEVRLQEWKYLEVRPINVTFYRKGEQSGFRPARRYRLHSLDLRPDLDQIRLGFHKDSILRRIRRAEHAGLVEKTGRSKVLLERFYNLLVITRARHQLPPQPFEWFENLIDCLGDGFQIRLAYQKETAVAAILTLRFKDVVFYKYGCSDAKYKNLGGIPLLLWRAIQDAKSTSAREFSLGRSDEDNPGLIAFKSRWTPQTTSLVYWRYPGPASLKSREGWRVSLAKRVFGVLPRRLLTATGRLIYRHIG